MTVDRDAICEAFIEAVPFDMYPFQEEAILGWFEAEGGLLVSAPTGMGKTLIAETAVFEALKSGQTLYYTTPLIALTDQKLTDLQDKAESWGYPRESVGLLTGNRKVNPDAPIKVVVAEILLNHLLEPGRDFSGVSAVVMDEFHYFNDYERGVVWELSLVLLPPHVRLLLLSATVGNAVDFILWVREEHGRKLRLVQTQERKIPLEHHWVDDKLLTELLVDMVNGERVHAPALVFCFSRDECWEMAERLKGLPLIAKETRTEIEAVLEDFDLKKGIGPKLRQMLIRGVGVHHAGVLPSHKAVVEKLFLKRLIPYVVCTETLAAGINLPARSVVLKTLLKGKPGERKLIPASDAHQMFGRAGRPQFDTEGHVYAVAHDDDVKLNRWKEKIEKLEATGSKDPGVLNARKQLERKKPKRRTTEQYWVEAQFDKLLGSGPADLRSRSMIPYPFLLYLLEHDHDVPALRRFLAKRFGNSKKLAGFEKELEHMLANLVAGGYLLREEDSDEVELTPDAARLHGFRSVDPMFGAYLAETLNASNRAEKLLALEGALFLPWRVVKSCGVPWDLEPGPLRTGMLEPLMIQMGINVALPEKDPDDDGFNPWKEEEERPPTFVDMLKIAFESALPWPEDLMVQEKWVAGGIFEANGDFHAFVGSRTLSKNEGLVMRHLLRLVILAGEFFSKTGDPDYEDIATRTTAACESVDPSYTEKFLSNVEEAKGLFG